jgi:hypothetical protein
VFWVYVLVKGGLVLGLLFFYAIIDIIVLILCRFYVVFIFVTY